MYATDTDGEKRRIYGMFAAISKDEGESWSTPKPITPGESSREVTYFDRDTCVLDATHAEPRGYLDACQTPDAMIHLITSRNYYAFNLAWLERPVAPAP